jgi:hypothetical protein
MHKNVIFCPKKADFSPFWGKKSEFCKNEKGIPDFTRYPFSMHFY